MTNELKRHTRTNNSDINPTLGVHNEALVRCMDTWIRKSFEALERGDYRDAATCVRLAYTFEQQVHIAED